MIHYPLYSHNRSCSMELIVMERITNNAPKYFPLNDNAKNLAGLMKEVTFSSSQLSKIKTLGFRVIVQTYSNFKTGESKYG